MISIIEALDDTVLFAPSFRGLSWNAWRVFLQGLFALPMSPEELAVFQAHTGRKTAPERTFREAAIVCGRRGGKSRVLALVAVYLACFRDYSAHLAAGEQGVVAIIASDRRQGRVLLRYVRGLLRTIPLLKGEVESEVAEAITLKNGVAIEIHTSSIASPRGRTFVAVLADEIAFWSSEESANPDVEIIASVRPGLVSIPGSILLMASSPYARKGVLWRVFRENYGKDGRVLVWKGTTQEMNPLIDPELIREAYEADPASGAAEFGAEFRADVEAFVNPEVVEAAVITGRYELPWQYGPKYFGFIDPSGAAADAMTMAISHCEPNGSGVLDCIRERRPPFSPENVVAEFADVLKGYKIMSITGDRWGGEWVAEAFRKHGIVYQVSDKVKSAIYLEFLPLLNSGSNCSPPSRAERDNVCHAN
jgi:hypothetical protein